MDVPYVPSNSTLKSVFRPPFATSTCNDEESTVKSLKKPWTLPFLEALSCASLRVTSLGRESRKLAAGSSRKSMPSTLIKRLRAGVPACVIESPTPTGSSAGRRSMRLFTPSSRTAQAKEPRFLVAPADPLLTEIRGAEISRFARLVPRLPVLTRRVLPSAEGVGSICGSDVAAESGLDMR